MGILQITLFGCVGVNHSDWKTAVVLTREIQALLAFLLIQRHRVHSREVLADIFWGEHSQGRARASLNTALWKLKKALEPQGTPAGTYLINNHPGEVGFNRESPYWLDVEVFENEINQLLAYPSQMANASHVQEIEKTLSLYKGELLEGCYKDWVLPERERLRALYIQALIYLLQYHKSHAEYEKAAFCGKQILNLDPLREEIHREMMRLYSESGQRALAVRQYGICRMTLAKELNISPMEETHALFTQIIAEADSRRSPAASQLRSRFDQAIEEIREASMTIKYANEQMQNALQSLAKYSEHPD